MEVTESFVEYIKTKPVVFEVFGHLQQHPLHLQGQELSRFEPDKQRFLWLLLLLLLPLAGKGEIFEGIKIIEEQFSVLPDVSSVETSAPFF